MLYIEKDMTIRLTRGDTAYLRPSITDEMTGETYEIQPEDVVIMTIKKSVRDSEPLISKRQNGDSVIKIEPSDTTNLDFGKYKYDVQLVKENGDVFTVIEPSVFELLQEVTW